MALAIRFLPHAVRLLTFGGISAWINQIESVNPDHGITLFEETTGSATDREFVAAKDVMPTVPVVTSDLTILSTVGFSGAVINSSGGHPGAVVYARELPLEALPTAIATAHHISMSISDGLLVPVSLRASHNAVAKLSLMLHAILGSDGTSGATPMVIASSQAIASGAGATSNIYTTGPFKYTVSGGSSRLVQGIRDINVDFGIQLLKESTDGDVYPTHVSIIARATKIEFTTTDVELAAEIGDGVSVSAAAAYFRNVAANGQRTASGTTSHVSVAGTAGVIVPGAQSLAHKQPGTAAFTFVPVLNTNLITVSVAAAIPTS